MRLLLKKQQAGLIGVLTLAFAARLIGLTSQSFWYDEAFSILFSEKGIAAMLKGTLTQTGAGSADIHPLGYYSLSWAWMRLFGESPIAVKMLSVLAGLGVVALIYLLTSELFGSRTAFIAGIIVALNPFQIYYAQQIRMYGFLALWLLLATYTYWRAVQSKQWSWWIGFAIFAALAQYTHNLAAFYLVALALWPLITKDWQTLKAITLAGLLALLLYLPWLIHLPAQFAKVEQNYWVMRPTADRLLTLLLTYITNSSLPDRIWFLAGLFITLYVVSIALWQTFRVLRQRQADSLQGIWMLYLAITPPILMFLFSQWKPVYLERALLPSGAVFCIWLAWVLTQTQIQRPLQAAVSLLLFAGFGMGAYQHLTYTGFPYGPYEAMTKSIQSKLQPGDAIIHSSKLSMLPSVYYNRSLVQTYVGDPPGSNVDTLAPATQQVLGLIAKPDIESAAGNAKRVWFIIFEQSNQEYVRAGYPRHAHLTWLLEHYSQVEVENWSDLRVYLFSKRP